jgi:hypothetical protein
MQYYFHYYVKAFDKSNDGTSRLYSIPGDTANGPGIFVPQSDDELEGIANGLLPTEFAMAVHPNPFNNQLSIKLAIPESMIVKVRLYNIRGREVCELHNGILQAGYHLKQFDASMLSSGLYFCHTVANTEVSVNKLVLIK